MRLWLAVVTCTTALAGVTAAWADIVHLRGGGRIEGVVRVEGDIVTVANRYGSTSVPVASVERVEKSETALSRYNRLASGAAAGDLKAQRELVKFCREHGLTSRERYHLLLVLRLRPGDIEARSALGYVQRGGAWLTKSEEMHGRGLIQFRGKWMSPGAKEAVRSRERERKRELAAKRREEREERAASVRARRLAQRRERRREGQGYLGITYVDERYYNRRYYRHWHHPGRYSITSPYYGGYYYPYERYTGGWSWYRRWTGAGLSVNYRSRNWRVRW